MYLLQQPTEGSWSRPMHNMRLQGDSHRKIKLGAFYGQMAIFKDFDSFGLYWYDQVVENVTTFTIA